MFEILALILMFSQIECQSLCETIKPNGIFNGLQIYRKYTDREEESLLVMNNREGSEWVFDITFNEQFSLNMSDSITTTDMSADYKFGVIGYNTSEGSCYFCTAFQNCIGVLGNKSLEIECQPKGVSNTSLSLPFDDYMVLNPFSRQMIALNNTYVLFFERKTKSVRYIVYPFTNKVYDCNSARCDQIVPKFVDQMNVTLFSQIEGIAEFKSIVGKGGHLLLFRIDGRPKFCFTFDNESISNECINSKNMRTLFDKCFPKKSIDDLLVWVVVILAVIAIIIFLSILLKNGSSRRKLKALFSKGSVNTTIKDSD